MLSSVADGCCRFYAWNKRLPGFLFIAQHQRVHGTRKGEFEVRGGAAEQRQTQHAQYPTQGQLKMQAGTSHLVASQCSQPLD
ncbi:hypothetical protein ACV334_38825, partial [Pseudomonas aeruginosa]